MSSPAQSGQSAPVALLIHHAPSRHPLLTPIHLYYLLLGHCSLAFLFSGLLTHPTSLNLLSLDGEAQQDGGEPELAPGGSKTGCKVYPMPSPPLYCTKPGVLLSFFRSFPSYLSTMLPLFRQSSGNPPLLLVGQSSFEAKILLIESWLVSIGYSEVFGLACFCSFCVSFTQ